MANQKNIEATYDYMDDIFQESLGSNADISCARYNNDFRLSLGDAQKAKHEFILNSLNFKTGDRILDIGCGWGPVLKAVKEKGGEGTGLTLSPAQAKACKKGGLNALIKDWKELCAHELGKFVSEIYFGMSFKAANDFLILNLAVRFPNSFIVCI